MVKQISVFCKTTNKWDPVLSEMIINDTRQSFKEIKAEQRHKKVVRFLATKRELLYSLEDANLSLDLVNAPVAQPDSRFDPRDVSHLIEMN